jgi:hypothetical protein
MSARSKTVRSSPILLQIRAVRAPFSSRFRICPDSNAMFSLIVFSPKPLKIPRDEPGARLAGVLD